MAGCSSCRGPQPGSTPELALLLGADDGSDPVRVTGMRDIGQMSRNSSVWVKGSLVDSYIANGWAKQ